MYSDFITGMIDKSFEKIGKLMQCTCINLQDLSYVVTNLFLNEYKYIFLGRKQGTSDNPSVTTEGWNNLKGRE